MYQVTWELLPTSWESEVDIIKELLEVQSKEKEPSEAENSSVGFSMVSVSNSSFNFFWSSFSSI